MNSTLELLQAQTHLNSLVLSLMVSGRVLGQGTIQSQVKKRRLVHVKCTTKTKRKCRDATIAVRLETQEELFRLGDAGGQF